MTDEPTERTRMPRVWDGLAGKIGIGLTIAVSVALDITPLVVVETTGADGTTTEEALTLGQSEGWGLAIVRAEPVLFALVIGFTPRTSARAA